MDERTKRARDIQQRIGEVLLRHWDPVGVKDEPAASDEYDAYVGGVYRLLVSGASARAVAEHLAGLESGMLGYEDTDHRTLIPLARKLQRLNVRLRVDEREQAG